MQTVTTVKDFEQVIHQLETLKENVRKIEESKTNEHNFVVHNNIVLLEVDREAVEGDYVVFDNLSNGGTENGKFYKTYKTCMEEGEVICYTDDLDFHCPFYSWDDTSYTVKVYEVIGNLPQSTPVAYSTKPSRKRLTANQKRAMIISKAKQFVEQTIEDARDCSGYITVRDAHFPNIPRDCREIKFVVNTEKRTVVALAIGAYTHEVVEKAIAKCDPNDVLDDTNAQYEGGGK